MARDPFYPAFALIAAAVAFGGFAITYLAPVAQGTFAGPTAIHIHAAVFFAWIAILVAQTQLAWRGRVAAHRRLGAAAALLVPAMIGSGTYVTLAGGATAFAIIPLTDLALFAILIARALLARRRPAWHARFVVLANAAILPAAFARAMIPLGVVTTWPSTLAADVLWLAGAALDLRARRGLHPAYRWGALVLAVHVARELVVVRL
jgi:hypothetical protein